MHAMLLSCLSTAGNGDRLSDAGVAEIWKPDAALEGKVAEGTGRWKRRRPWVSRVGTGRRPHQVIILSLPQFLTKKESLGV